MSKINVAGQHQISPVGGQMSRKQTFSNLAKVRGNFTFFFTGTHLNVTVRNKTMIKTWSYLEHEIWKTLHISSRIFKHLCNSLLCIRIVFLLGTGRTSITNLKTTETSACTEFNTWNSCIFLLVFYGTHLCVSHDSFGIKIGFKYRTQNGCKQCCPATEMNEDDKIITTRHPMPVWEFNNAIKEY